MGALGTPPPEGQVGVVPVPIAALNNGAGFLAHAHVAPQGPAAAANAMNNALVFVEAGLATPPHGEAPAAAQLSPAGTVDHDTPAAGAAAQGAPASPHPALVAQAIIGGGQVNQEPNPHTGSAACRRLNF